MHKKNRPDIYWDSIADIYQRETRISQREVHYGPLIPGEDTLKLLPTPLAGLQALELGCGAAQNSIVLAKAGAHCTAIDCAPQQVAFAKELARKAQVEVEVLRGDLCDATLPEDLCFDIIHSSNALQFVDDPAFALKTAASLLKPTGILLISVPHPLFASEWVDLDEDGPGLFLTDYFNPAPDIRESLDGTRVVSRSYPLSVWVGWCHEAGLCIDRLEEPLPADHPPYTSDSWESLRDQLQKVPATLIMRCLKTKTLT